MLIEHIPFDMQPISPRQRRRSRPPTACFHSCRRDLRAEYALDYILERKSVQDLLSSIKEERYERQKARAAPAQAGVAVMNAPTFNSCIMSPPRCTACSTTSRAVGSSSCTTWWRETQTHYPEVSAR